MPHFFGRRDGDHVTIEGRDARHLAGPLRARPGEIVSVVEPEGRLLSVRLLEVTPRSITGTVEGEREHRPEPSLRLMIALAMLPSAALEAALARCTELGAWSFVLVRAERSVGRAAKPQRWAAICREAAMLAGRLRVPEVRGPVELDELIGRVVMLDGSSSVRLAELNLGDQSTLLIGPEGGWTERERELFEERATLGPRNLRAENAAAAAAAVALARAGDL